MMYPYVGWFNKHGLDYFDPTTYQENIQQAILDTDFPPLAVRVKMREERQPIDTRLTASEARRRATTIDNTKVRSEVNRILTSITETSNGGGLRLDTKPPEYKVRDAVMKELRSLGYTCKYTSDQRDGDYWTVYW